MDRRVRLRVHNAVLVDDSERSVIRGPFRPLSRSFLYGEFSISPKPPWFTSNRRGDDWAAAHLLRGRAELGRSCPPHSSPSREPDLTAVDGAAWSPHSRIRIRYGHPGRVAMPTLRSSYVKRYSRGSALSTRISVPGPGSSRRTTSPVRGSIAVAYGKRLASLRMKTAGLSIDQQPLPRHAEASGAVRPVRRHVGERQRLSLADKPYAWSPRTPAPPRQPAPGPRK